MQRIVSLLPSTTEMVCLLGLRDRLVGVSHECDFPENVRGLPVLTAPKIDPRGRSAEIDRQVREGVAGGLSVYRIDQEKLRELRPDLILTQDACAVCAVSFEEVRAATRELIGNQVEIVSLSPLRLEDVLEDIVRVARAAGASARAAEVVAGLRTRLAGGEPVLGRDGEPTRRIEWERIVDAAPEVLLVIPCGFKVAQTVREMEEVVGRLARTPAVREGRVYVADGNAYFNRPGPRLVDSAEIAAAAIHPEL